MTHAGLQGRAAWIEQTSLFLGRGGRVSWYNLMRSPTHLLAYFSPGTEMCGHGLSGAFSGGHVLFISGKGCFSDEL